MEKLESAYSKESFDALKSEMSTTYNQSSVSLNNINSGGQSRLAGAYSQFLQNTSSSIGKTANSVE